MKIFRPIICLGLIGISGSLAADEPMASCANHAVDVCTNFIAGYSMEEAVASCKHWDSGMFSARPCLTGQVVGRCITNRQGQTIETLHYSITGRWSQELVRDACQRAGGAFASE